MKTTLFTSTQTLVTLVFLSELAAEPVVDQQEAPKSSPSASEATEQPATRGPLDNTVQLRPPTLASKLASSQKPDNTWIESILIQVESLNLNNERLAPPKQRNSQAASHNLASDYDSEARDQLQLNSSQAPTDSGEDPLEATTLTSSEISLNPSQSNATQYSLAPDSSAKQTTPVESNSSASQADQSAAEQVANTVLSNGILQDDNKQEELLAAAPASRQPITCEQAYTQCAKRLACAPALKAYNDDCQDLINNRTYTCSAKCLRAMIALRSSDEGADLVNCDCQANEYCIQSKQRSLACKPQVEEAVNPKTIVSCSTASWICMADQLCSTALGFYNRNCQSLFSQHYCSQRCNNSLSILYRQPKASKLISCHCDGSEEFPCVRYKTYTERLCLNIATPSGDAQMDADDDQQSEEESFNLTNDSETFVLGPPPASPSFGGGSTNNYNFNNEDQEYDDLRVTDNEESTSNGIHGLSENNYIPLVIARYFTNSRQQRLQQQKQQQQPRQQNSTISQQQHRRSPKNTKQKMRPNGSQYYESNRPRRSRLRVFRFASSASASSILGIREISVQAIVVSQQMLLLSLLFLLFK